MTVAALVKVNKVLVEVNKGLIPSDSTSAYSFGHFEGLWTAMASQYLP